jgi:hypothetical protein
MMRSILGQITAIKRHQHVPALVTRVPPDIPRHIIGPPVTRVIRLQISLNSSAQSYDVTAHGLAIQDGLDYLGSSVVRYGTIRIIHANVWMESFEGTSTLTAPGLVLIDAVYGNSYVDRATSGHTYAKVGLQMPFIDRTTFVATSDTATSLTIACDQSITSGQTISVIADVRVELQ